MSVSLIFLVLILTLVACGTDGSQEPNQAALRTAIRDLSSEAGPDRRQAAAQLEKILPQTNLSQGLAADAVKILRGLISDDRDDHVRAAAIRTLGVVKDLKSWKVIADRATNEEAQVRSEVIQALNAIDPVKAQPLILEALNDKEVSVRQVATNTLVSEPAGIEILKGFLEEKSPHFLLALTALSNSPSPIAQKALLAGLTSRNADFLLAAVHAVGKLKDQTAISQLTGILSQTDDRKRTINATIVRAAANTLATLGGKDAFTTLLAFFSKQNQDWMNPLLEPHAQVLRPILVEHATAGSQGPIAKSTLIHFLTQSPQPSEFSILAKFALPDEPQLLDLCKVLQSASTEIRAPIASRLRASLEQEKMVREPSQIIESLSYVGQVGQGPDVEFLVSQFRKYHEATKNIKTSIPGSRELQRNFGFACLRLKAPGLEAIYIDLLNDPQGVNPLGLQGVLQAGNIEAVNQTLLRIGNASSASAPHLWHLVTDKNAELLAQCHDPRLVPGLASLLLRKQEQGKVCDLLMSNGTREAVMVLLEKLRNPEIPLGFKRDTLYPLMPRFGAVGRPIFIEILLQEPPPKQRGDPDLGWWCADFLRVQADEAAPDLLTAIKQAPPKRHVAARCIQALELATSSPAIDALVSWLSDPDQEIANFALNALMRQQRTSVLPAIKSLRDKTPEGQWRNRLDFAISTLKSITK